MSLYSWQNKKHADISGGRRTTDCKDAIHLLFANGSNVWILYHCELAKGGA